MAKTMPKTLDTPARQKRLLALLEEYIKSCRPPPEADSKKTLHDLQILQAFAAFWVAVFRIYKSCAPKFLDFTTSSVLRLRTSS